MVLRPLQRTVLMAYLAFQDLGGAAAVRFVHAAPPRHDPAPAADRLSALEWSVVAIARGDGRASLRRPGRLATAMGAVLGRPNPRLADERLEALRRLAVLAWLDGDTVPLREKGRFVAAGFTPGQYDLLTASIRAGVRAT